MTNRLPQLELAPQTADAVKAALEATQGDHHSYDTSLRVDYSHVYDPGTGFSNELVKAKAVAKSTSGAVFETDTFQVNDSGLVIVAEPGLPSGRGDGSVLVSRTDNGETITRTITGDHAQKLTQIIMRRVERDATSPKAEK